MDDFAVQFDGISKRFGAVVANSDISFGIPQGSIHGLIGENGAGKSTLMSILFGYYRPDSGVIRLRNRLARIQDSKDAIAAGIGMVHQHFMLVDTLTVAENMVLGTAHGWKLQPEISTVRAHLHSLDRSYGLYVDPDARVGDLSVGLQQRVEILKALHRGAEVLILDEPTAVLTPQQADQLFIILRALKAQNKTVILVTHKLREVMEVTDQVTVLRDGKVIETFSTQTVSAERLATAMVGRSVQFKVDKPPAKPGPIILSARGLSLTDARGVAILDDINFDVYAGEIVGIAGVAGNGQSELLELIAGLRAATAGQLRYLGNDLNQLPGQAPAAAKARQQRIAHVPEDRRYQGLAQSLPIFENLLLGYQGDQRWQRYGFFRRRAVLAHCQQMMKRFDIRPPSATARAAQLSGGNQQKIVLAREIEADPTLLLVGQPTRGVDIGAIEWIYLQLLALRGAGKAILLVSVELDEILALSDRILVIAGGRLTASLSAEEASAETLGLYMGGQAMDGLRVPH